MYRNCSECQNKKQFVYTTYSELAILMYWTANSMNNLLSYCGLVDARLSTSEEDLPVYGPKGFSDIANPRACQPVILFFAE